MQNSRNSAFFFLSIATCVIYIFANSISAINAQSTCLPISIGPEMGQAKTNVSGSSITEANIVGLWEIREYSGDEIGWATFTQPPGYLYAFKLSNITMPTLIAGSEQALTWENPASIYGISPATLILDDRPNIMAIGVDSGAVNFIDISDPAFTSFSGGFVAVANVSIYSMAYQNPYVFVCQSDGNLTIYDATTIITDPTGTNIVDILVGTDCNYGMVALNDELLVSKSTGFLEIYDFSNPLSVTSLGSIDLSTPLGGSSLGHISIHPNTSLSVAYITLVPGVSVNMVAVDFSNSSAPALTDTFTTGSASQPLSGSITFSSDSSTMFVTNTDGEVLNYCVEGLDAHSPQQLTQSPLTTGYGPNMGRSIVNMDGDPYPLVYFSVQFETPSVGIATPSIRIRLVGNCGDGVIGPGEECDPSPIFIHSLNYFCCDRGTCLYKSSGTVCPGVTGHVCTISYAECTGNSTACSEPIYEDIGTSCDADGEACSIDLCKTGGVCTLSDNSNCILIPPNPIPEP